MWNGQQINKSHNVTNKSDLGKHFKWFLPSNIWSLLSPPPKFYLGNPLCNPFLSTLDIMTSSWPQKGKCHPSSGLVSQSLPCRASFSLFPWVTLISHLSLGPCRWHWGLLHRTHSLMAVGRGGGGAEGLQGRMSRTPRESLRRLDSTYPQKAHNEERSS